MSRCFASLGLVAFALVLSAAHQLTAAEANTAPARFLTALDLEGKAHHLGNGEGARALALVFMTTECPISREYVPELNRLAAEFAEKDIAFYGVICEPSASRSEAAKFAAEFKIAFPVLFDASGELCEVLKPTHVPEAFVVRSTGEVVYRGRIDDRYPEVGRKRSEATTHDLADALTAVVENRDVAVAETTPVGCPIASARPDDKPAAVTFNRDIAPLVFANCAECHRPGEVAPFSLLSYEDASKRAEHLADVTANRLMPPWKAEIGHGRFLGERHLTDAQIALFDAWAKAGAPQGDPADLPPTPQFASGWRLGEPDLVLEAAEAFEMPADGPDIFQHIIISLEAAAGKTVVGFEFRPGNPAIVHHAILFLDRSGTARRKDAETPEPGYTTSGSIDIPVAGMLGVWTPGMTPRFFPKDVGTPIAPGTDLVLQLHLHPSGKVESDRSSIALYFAEEGQEPTSSTTTFVTGTLLIDIPKDTPDHTVRATFDLPAEITLISLLPHMHMIGKEMKITATLPDGSLLPLVWIKEWNFLWQDNYVYQEPVTLPAGTKMELVASYDNTNENPAQPSKPAKRVLFGNGSTDEMCFGIFQVVMGKPEEERKIHMSMMASFMKDWANSKIDAEAKAHIMEEAGKLFGTGGGGGRGRSLEALIGGGEGRRRRDRDRDRDAEEKPPEAAPAETPPATP